MGSRPWLVMVALVGCSSDHGVAIEVSAPAELAVDRVELLIAPHECMKSDGMPCDRGIAWDTTDAKQPGPIFVLNDDKILDASIGADGFARFRLEPEGTDNFVERIVAIGYHGTTAVGVATIENATLPQHHAEIWRMPLEVLLDIPRADPHTADGMHVWRRKDTSLAACIVIERVSNGSGAFEFVVPPDDTDCDDEQPECDGFWAHYKASSSNANCLTKGPLNLAACTLGNTTCADGVTTGTCAQSSPETCVPDVFCMCNNPIDSTCILTTFSDQASLGGLPYFACSFPEVGGASCQATLSNGTALIDLDAEISLAASCDSLQFIPLQGPVPKAVDALLFNGLAFKAAKFTSGGKRCTFTLTWASGTFNMAQDASGFFDIALHTGKHMLIPYELGFSDMTACPLQNMSSTICPLAPAGGAPIMDHVFDCSLGM